MSDKQSSDQADVIVNFSLLVMILALQVLLTAGIGESSSTSNGKLPGGINVKDVSLFILTSKGCDYDNKPLFTLKPDNRTQFKLIKNIKLNSKNISQAKWCGYLVNGGNELKRKNFTRLTITNAGNEDLTIIRWIRISSTTSYPLKKINYSQSGKEFFIDVKRLIKKFDNDNFGKLL